MKNKKRKINKMSLKHLRAQWKITKEKQGVNSLYAKYLKQRLDSKGGNEKEKI